MADSKELRRHTALEGLLPERATADLEVREASPAARVNLRIAGAAQDGLDTVAGFDLTARINTLTGSHERFALRLGPDEWLLVASGEDAARLVAELEAELAGRSHSVVDNSHRLVGLVVSGTSAADVLNAGCPLDLSSAAFPTGSATRTVFARAEIILARIDERPTYRLEIVRSFAPYVAGLILDAGREVWRT